MSNPFESPEYGDPAVPANRRTLRLKRVGVLSVAIFMGVAGVLMGLIVGLFALLASLLGAVGGADNPGVVFGMGAGMLIIAPLMYGVMGFLAGLANAAVYNLVAGMSGGIELDLEQD